MRNELGLLIFFLLTACSLRPGASTSESVGSDVVKPLWLDNNTGTAGHIEPLNCPKVVALLIGIGHYDPANGWENLSSENDLALMIETLRKQGVNPDAIHTLTNQQATKAGIERTLKAMADTLHPGQQLIILYTGHARQLPDDDGDEMDGYDEAIVPYDAPPVNSPQSDLYLRDDELNRYLTKIRAILGPSGSLWLIFDSCHAQTLNRGQSSRGQSSRGQSSRGQLTQRTRGGVPPLGRPATIHRKRSVVNPLHSGSDWYETPAMGKLAPYVLFAATTDGGPNFETTDAAGHSLGPLTRAVSEAWDRRFPVDTYRSLFDRIAVEMTRYAPYQQPGLEGDVDANTPGCEKKPASTPSLYSTTGERLRIAWPATDELLTKRLADLPFVQSAGLHPDLRVDRQNDHYRLWIAASHQLLSTGTLSIDDCIEHIRQYFTRNVLLQLRQTGPDFRVQATMQRVAVKTEQGRTVVTDTLPALTTTGLPTFRTSPNERMVLTLTNTGAKPAYLTVVDLLPNGTLHVLLPGEGEPAMACRLLPGQILQRRIRIKEPIGAEVYKILVTPDPIDLRAVLQTRGTAPARHPYELLFQRTYTTRGMPQAAPLSFSEQTGATSEVVFWVLK